MQLAKIIKVGDVFDNPGGGTSTVDVVANDHISYIRGNSRIILPLDIFNEVINAFAGQKCTTADLREYNAKVFDSKKGGHSCNCTFLFSLAEKMGLINGDTFGGGKRNDPFFVVFK